MSAKLSANYNSIGMDAGVTFKTRADRVEKAIDSVTTKLKQKIGERLNDLQRDLN